MWKSASQKSTWWLRQDGLDGFLWRSLGAAAPCKESPTVFGMTAHLCGGGWLTTPLLFPWEIDRCETKPCKHDCIAIPDSIADVVCSARASWPVEMLGRLITRVFVPLLLLRVLLALFGATLLRLRRCGCAHSASSQWAKLRRACRFSTKRYMKMCGTKCSQCCAAMGFATRVFVVFAVVGSLFFFSQ